MKGSIVSCCAAALAPILGFAAFPGAPPVAPKPMHNSGTVVERALAVNLGGSDRDAVVFRTEDHDGIAIFAPLADGRFELRLFPGLGPEVYGVFEADADGDGRTDLIVGRHDGSFAPWLVDGNGHVVPEPVLIAPSHHGAHHAVEPSAAELDAKRIQDAAHETLRSRLAQGELGATLFDDQIRSARPGAVPDGAVSAVTARFEPAGISGIVAATADGRIVLLDSAGAPHAVDVAPLPAGFRPRLVAFGRFGRHGEPAAAVVSDGARPRLVVIEARSGGDLVVREFFSPTTTVNVSVGSGGLSFAPDPVNIQAGDTVHWTWVGVGHTVTSGSACVADGAYCSPSNASCSTAPASNTGATYDRTFPLAGNFPYFCRPHCVLGMTGTVIVAAAPASPGSVPDGATVLGVPLKLGKGLGGSLDLSWSNSCTGTATNYAVYEGSVPITGTYDHAALNCTLGNTNTANIAPGLGDRYYLVVPETASNDGSYGLDRIGGVRHQIPAAAIACKPQLVSACP